MGHFTEEELRQAYFTIEPITVQLEKMKPKFKEGTSQHTLLIRRVRAFNIALELIKGELSDVNATYSYTEEALKEALRAIESTIGKSVKIPPKLKEGTTQHALLLRRIRAYNVAKMLLLKCMDTICQEK